MEGGGLMTNITVGSFSLGEGPLTAGDCLGMLLITLLSHRPQSLATPRADPTRPAIRERLRHKHFELNQFFQSFQKSSL